ncbi:MAG: DNA mismatch repair endonuclease MutL [Lachnospiraceae bacterium]|nr:DNA mismatch repair endonuclease MutL [Lachnospiraceae bacterium]
MSIKILDNETINKISAGEVVENAASVVKELVENSIDANAKNIKIYISGGGLNEIKIVDDGIGIIKEDIKNAFKEHATSKLDVIEDLDNISTFGFRGEALPSIAAVSDVEIISKSDKSNDLYGYKYSISNKFESELEEVAANAGTIISVKNLFSNVPVRKKFLKDISRENSYISDIVSKFALSNPNISFLLTIDGRQKLKTKGDGNLKSIIYEIYGKDVYENLIEIDAEKRDVKILGFIAKPIIARNLRNDEIYFVNNRFVKDKTVFTAIENAYEGYLMQHKFPFVCLMIKIPGDKVDVNVHPKKIEVRFVDSIDVGFAIYEIILEKLKSINLIHEEKLSYFDNSTNNSAYDNNDIKELKANYNVDTDNNVDVEEKDIKENIDDKFNNDDRQEEKINISKNVDDLPTLSDIFNKKLSKGLSYDNLAANIENSSLHKFINKNFIDVPIVEKNIIDNHKYIGQVFNTYILFEYDDKFYIVDQHAAHEKINFEKIMNEYKEGKVLSQSIYPSIIIRLNDEEYVAVEKNLKEFNNAGFEIEIFGDRDIKVDAVPYAIFNIASRELLMDMIDSFVDTNNREEYGSIVEKIASISCKKAIKANHELNDIEAKELIKKLFSLKNPYNCPHGRPTTISLSKTEFEKRFGRIVL